MIRSNVYDYDSPRNIQGNCLICDPTSSIVDQERLCQSYCKRGTKNAFSDKCQNCILNN